MRTLQLTLVAFVLACPAMARSVQDTVYLPVREGQVVKGLMLEEAPSDADPPVDWRRGVGTTESTDHGQYPPR